MWSSNYFFGISHAFVRVTAVTRDCLVRNSGFEAQIIADLRAILEVLPGQRYRGASGGLLLRPIASDILLVDTDDLRLRAQVQDLSDHQQNLF
jgi:hypothetical protein